VIILKTPREIALMASAGQIIAKVFLKAEQIIKPGLSTYELDKICEQIIRENLGSPTFLNYNGFPASVCLSVNDVLVHGIPSKKIILKEGDIVSLDVGVTYKGYCADAARTYPVGKVTSLAKKLIEVTEESFFKAVALIKPGVSLGDISHAIQTHNEKHGYSLPRGYTGHGIGQNLHEDPIIPNVGLPNTGPTLKEGMCLAIEPMVAMGKPDTYVARDGWSVKMKDGKISSHYENTVVVTKNGYEILTLEKEVS
jgi:methionyl aminopeptidase